ncbi:MAG: amino acid ABC transporter ATP-binding protein [Planctomycetota bacterium]|nr:amino acid ABC transporter ATP-binding protein [Planctomycetota bacterium]
MTTPRIHISGLCKRFGPVTVLEGLDLDVAQGEHLALIGPSGSGKSTILRLLMTLETPSEGTIQIDSEDLWPPHNPSELDRAARAQQKRLALRIGMVFQHFNLFPHLNVIGNIALAPQLVAGRSAAEARQQAAALLERVGLGDKGEAYPAELSGGQKQRVAIARALAMEPDIMLFDEATSALDPELVGEVLSVIRDLAASGDMTMLFVTHQLHFVEQFADRVAMLDGGKIIEQGPPSQVLHNPQHERTCAFLAAVDLSH